MTRNEKKAEFYKKNEWGAIIKVRVALGKMITIRWTGTSPAEKLANGWI